MLWSEKLENWKSGKDIPKYPSYIKKQFFWETSPIYRDIDKEFEETFIESDRLETLDEDYSPFIDYIDNSVSRYATSFDNPSKDTKLIIPIPDHENDYSGIKLFLDNAPIEQQQYLWSLVSKEVNNMLERFDRVWVSTHGLGVSYLHVRIDSRPKYYKTKKYC